MTQNFSTMSQFPPGMYPVALSVKTGSVAPVNITGMNFKLSNTGQSSGYSTIGSVLPTVSAVAAQTIYYYVLKRPTLQSSPGASSNMAIYQTDTYQMGTIVSALGTNMFYGDANTSAPSNSINNTPLFQVMATAVKGW